MLGHELKMSPLIPYWEYSRVDLMAASSADGTDVPTAEMLIATRVDSTDVVSAVLIARPWLKVTPNPILGMHPLLRSEG